MQRLFSTFPGGWPGVGLLLLRAIVGGVAAIQWASWLSAADHPTVAMICTGLLALLVGVTLIAGLLTPVSSLIVGLSYGVLAFSLYPGPGAALFLDRLSALFGLVVAGAIALLGPGAFSIDARLFGRREIFIPRDTASSRQ